MVDVSYGVPEGLPDASLLGDAGARLAAMEDGREDAFATLFKLVDNVLEFPEDAKKRQVRKGAEVFHRKVGRHEAAVDFLRACGFRDADDPDDSSEAGRRALLQMPVAFFMRLTDAHHVLAQHAARAGLPAPGLPGGGGFNPYLSNRQSTDSTRTPKAPEAWKSEAERLREEVKRKQQEMREQVEAAPAVDVKPSCFWLSAGRRLEEAVREAEEQSPEEARAADNALLQSQVASAKSAIAGPSKFESADKRRLADLSRTRVYAFCILRIICPDKSVLQVQFRAGDRGARVLEAIRPLLAPQVQAAGWYIYQTPPLRKLNPQETLEKAGLTPGANMYLGFEQDKPPPPYLEARLVAQLGPAPQEEGRGVNAAAGPTFSGEAMGWGSGKRLGGGAAAAPAPAAAERPASGAGRRL
ncbi:unnamed protein product, partial [Prorocentrum cordatum]